MSARSHGASYTSAAAEGRLSSAVSQLTRGWIWMAKEEARALGLSLPQVVLLGTLDHAGTMPVTRLAEMIGSSPSAATGLIDGLESAGYISRAHGGGDRRQVRVTLTPKGRRLGQRLKRALRARWNVYTQGIAAAQVDAASEVLELILQRMGPDSDHRSPPKPPHRKEGT